MIQHSPPTTRTPQPSHHCSAPNLLDAATDDHSIKHRSKRKHDDELSRMETMMSDMKTMFSDLLNQQANQNTKFEALCSIVSEVKTQNMEIQKSVEFLASKYDETSPAYPAALKKLHFLARGYAKKHGYEQCWISNGKVNLRKKEGMPSVIIELEDDFNKLPSSV